MSGNVLNAGAGPNSPCAGNSSKTSRIAGQLLICSSEQVLADCMQWVLRSKTAARLP